MMITNSFSRYGDSSIVIDPQIGHPLLLKISKVELKSRKSFQIEIWLLAGKNNTVKAINNEISGNLNVYPLLGINSKSSKDVQADRSVRGEKIPFEIEKITEKRFKKLEDSKILDYYYKFSENEREYGLGTEPPRRFLLEWEVFLDRQYCYQILGKIKLTDEIRNYLKTKSFILFDLVQNFPLNHKEHEKNCNKTRFLYHSICLYVKDSWKNLEFAQISDLHISRRNDKFLGNIKKNLRMSPIKTIKDVYDKSLKPIFSKLEKSAKNLVDSSLNESIKTALQKPKKIPLEKRIKNPNNSFRRFIKKANSLAEKNKLDFIVITGDLVDFCTSAENYLSSNPEFKKFINFEDTNWVKFLDILLNRPLKHNKNFQYLGIESSEELLVPIFTIPGNHGWRIAHYSIMSIGIFKKLGMTRLEAMNYDEPPATNPISASKKSIIPYLQYINPFLDYFIKLGDHTLLFLDSGPESIAEIKYLLMADPNTTGFNDEQLTYVNNIFEKLVKSDEEQKENMGLTFLLSHAPILNHSKKKSMRIKFLQKLNLIPNFEIKDFRESKLIEIGEIDPRSDVDLEYRSGTISQNWIKIMGTLNRYNAFHLAGHTHKWREYRIKRANSPTISSTGYGKKIINPFSIYWDDYSKLYGESNIGYFKKNLPFCLQTPSLALSNMALDIKEGGYRVIKIRNNKLKKIKMYFL